MVWVCSYNWGRYGNHTEFLRRNTLESESLEQKGDGKITPKW
jgi:hypothetical protein